MPNNPIDKETSLPLIVQKDNFELFLDEIIDIIYKKAEEHEIDGLKFAFNYKGNIQPFFIKSRNKDMGDHIKPKKKKKKK